MKYRYKKRVMNTVVLAILLSLLVVIISSCGMTPEEIDISLANLNTAYESGIYDIAMQEVEKLDKSYKKMSDEQKNKYESLKSSAEYAIASEQGINDGLSAAQSFYDQKMYYEAQQELDKISQSYILPPNEQKKFDEKQTLISAAIKEWKITEAFQKTEEAFNVGNYNLARTNLLQIDVSSLSEMQNQLYQMWQKKIEFSELLIQAESYYKKGKYTSATNTLSGIDSAYLSSEQNQRLSSLKEKITAAKAEEERKKLESMKVSKEQATELVEKKYKCAGASFQKEDSEFYYFIPYARFDPLGGISHPMGICKVNKKTGEVIEVEGFDIY